MPQTAPTDRATRFTDEDLRADLAAGLKPVEIARKHGVSRSAVTQRVKRLDLTTVSAAAAPRESERHVEATIDVMDQLRRNLRFANLLLDACDEWLRDPRRPEKYDLGPRSGEVDITYEVEIDTGKQLVVQKRKKRLSELLDLIQGEIDAEGGRIIGWKRGEWRTADPRELILKTQAECRQGVGLFADLLQKLTDAETMREWRQAIVQEIGKESPEVASRIAERIQRTLVLHAAFAPGDGGAFGGPATLPGGE